MMITNFEALLKASRQKQKKKIAVAAAEDEAVLLALKNAVKEDIVEPILVGNQKKIEEYCTKLEFNISPYIIISENNPAESSKIAVRLIRENKAQLLMKGFVSTSALLKAVIDKENGLKKGELLSHVALFESPYYHKMFAVTDAAMNIAPALEEKITIIANACEVFHKMDISNPKVAVICPVETVSPKIESTRDAAILTIMGKRNQIKGCIIDGPLALDNAVSKEAAQHKNIVSDVAGDADILLVNDLDSGNALYKSLLHLGGAKTAAVVVGASVPVVLTSRADTEESKLYSIALATLLA